MHGAIDPIAMAAMSLFSGFIILTTIDSVSGGRGQMNWLARSAMLNSDDDTKKPPIAHLSEAIIRGYGRARIKQLIMVILVMILKLIIKVIILLLIIIPKIILLLLLKIVVTKI